MNAYATLCHQQDCGNGTNKGRWADIGTQAGSSVLQARVALAVIGGIRGVHGYPRGRGDGGDAAFVVDGGDGLLGSTGAHVNGRLGRPVRFV